NRIPAERYRHAVVCLTSYSDFQDRIHQQGVPVIALNKRNGFDTDVYTRFWNVIQHLKPVIVHTRNLPSLEFQVPAALAQVPGRIHGEHGLDVYDLTGSNFKYRLFRKGMNPLVHRYVAVSRELADWLVQSVGAKSEKVSHINNGVDAKRFSPRSGKRIPMGP